MFLFSGEIYSMFNNTKLIEYARQVDYVSIHGQNKNYELYSFDLVANNCKILPMKSPFFRTTSLLEPIKE